MSSTATRGDLTGTIHPAEVETIAAGGAGVARLDGRAVFIPRTVPGDRVSFRILADKGRFLRGEFEEIARAGADRRDPPCPDWAECGGCPLQQMTPGGQTEAKSRPSVSTAICTGLTSSGNFSSEANRLTSIPLAMVMISGSTPYCW